MGATVDPQSVDSILEEMTASLASARQVIQSINSKPSDFEVEDGISLLSLKNHVMISYLQSLALISSRRAVGHALSERTPPSDSFGVSNRSQRGDGVGDLIDSAIEGRLVLEKSKALEIRMKYQVDKLVRISQEQENGKDVLNDALAFRPNPQALLGNDEEQEDEDNHKGTTKTNDGIYRPPRMAPVPYVPTQTTKEKRAARAPVPKSLSSLLHADGSLPHIESTSGLGNTPSISHTSSRARYLRDLTEYEENQFGRIVMGKKADARRRRDEEDLALGSGLAGIAEDGRGGGATAARWRKGGGLADEFGDILRDSGRGSGPVGDGYDELRQKGKRGNVLERSRASKSRPDMSESDVVDKKRKRSRFELERKNIKKRKP